MTVQDLLDRAAIQDLLLRYAHAVDRRDLTQVAACFTRDCTYDGTLGRGTIDAALEHLRTAMGRYETTLHLLGSQLIELDGDSARSETYAIAYHRLAGARLRTVAVRYCDELVRRTDGWRIRARIVHREWERLDTLETSHG